MVSASKILALAKKELGNKEYPAGSNKVKYNETYYGHSVSGSSYPWCAVFIWWLFYRSNAAQLYYGGEKTAYCPALLQYYESKGQIVSGGYKPGDLIFFDFNGNGTPDHIGICESFNGTYITTIDGNTGTDNEANGGCVMRRKRHKKYVCGAARPAYSKEKEDDMILPVLKKGSKGKSVKALQALLVGYGYNIEIDSSFGPATEKAVRKFQSSQRIAVDGSGGSSTCRKLLGV